MTSGASLARGDVLANEELCAHFKCGVQGGMQYSKSTNSLVLVLDHTKGLYEDQWIDEQRLDYVGTGQVGDQKLEGANKILAEYKERGIAVHLFEVFECGKYFYQGEVELVGGPYQKLQKDVNGNLRQVWVFPLRLVRGPRILSEEYLYREEEKEERQARAVQDDEELLRKANESPEIPPRVQVASQVYRRN